MYTLDDIMEIYKENEFPNNQDIYGWDRFAKEQRKFSWWYEWRRHQLERITDVFSFEKKILSPEVLGEFRLGWFQWLLKYYRDFLTDTNFLHCEQAKIKYAIHAANLQQNATLEWIKQAIRDGNLTEINLIWFEKEWVCLIQDWTQRSLAIAQMVEQWEKLPPLTVNWYVQVLDDAKIYPYVDYYPEENK